jgi:hypothetical protein
LLHSFFSTRVLTRLVHPGQNLVGDVNAGTDGHRRDDPAASRYGRGDEHCSGEAGAQGLSDTGTDTRRHR